MRFISKGVVAGVAAMSVLALGASGASATITPSSGGVTATNTGSVTLEGVITNTCTTVDFTGSINMNNPTTQGGGGIVTGMTADGCDLGTTGTFTTPWTLNINNEVSAGTWTGTISNVNVHLGGICQFTGTLNLEYSNSTGLMSITGGALAGNPSFLCGNGTVTGKWDLRAANGSIPQGS